MSWDPDAPLSPRPTELDSSSDSPVHDDVVVISDDDSPTSTIPGESVLPLAPHGAVSSGARAPAPPLISNESVAPYRHLNRMDEVIFKCLYFDNLYWALAAPGMCLQQHLDYVLNEVLCNARSHFKIGLTYLPHDRIYTYIDYCRHDRRMYVIAVSESPDDIANAEDAAIARYSLVHSVSGHPGCENRSRGKLGAFQGHSPFFLYLCVGNGSGWHQNRQDRGRCNLNTPRPWAPHFAEWAASRSAPSAGSGNIEWETAFGRRLQAARRRSDCRSRSPCTASEPA